MPMGISDNNMIVRQATARAAAAAVHSEYSTVYTGCGATATQQPNKSNCVFFVFFENFCVGLQDVRSEADTDDKLFVLFGYVSIRRRVISYCIKL